MMPRRKVFQTDFLVVDASLLPFVVLVVEGIDDVFACLVDIKCGQFLAVDRHFEPLSPAAVEREGWRDSDDHAFCLESLRDSEVVDQ